MRGLATPLADLILSAEHAVHGGHGAEVAAFIQQVGVHAGGCLVDEAFVVQYAEDLGTFGFAQRPRLRYSLSTETRRAWALPVSPIVGRSRVAQRGTCCPRADHCRQFTDGLIGHHFGSPPFVDS